MSATSKLFAIAGDWQVARRLARMPHPYGPEDARMFLNTIVPNELVRAITMRGTNAMVGMIGLTPDADRRSAELGYYVGCPHWGQGTATEAATAAVGHAFGDLGLASLSSGWFISDPASGRVLDKLGFVETGRSERPCLASGGTLPSVEMRLTPR